MSKISKLVRNPKLFFSDMANKRLRTTAYRQNQLLENHDIISTKNNTNTQIATIKKTPPKKNIVKTISSIAIPDIISKTFSFTHTPLPDSNLPVFMYFPWIQEHGNELIKKLNEFSNSDFIILPLNIAKDASDRENRKAINKFSREHPDVYRKIISRHLMVYRNKIKGFIFTLDWNPAMRIIVDVCREFDIPTILIPHESIFIDRNLYYKDITSFASSPKTDIVLNWGGLQTDIFSSRGYPKNRIVEVGTPKFDIYKNYKPLLTRKIFCNNFGLDENKKIILFAAQPLDSQLNQKMALTSQKNAITDLFNYTKMNNLQLLLRMPPSKDDILGAKLINDFESSDHAVIDDANFYLVPPEEAIFHCDFITSINSTMLFEGILMNKFSFSMKYVEFEQIWEKAGIPAVRNANELDELMNLMIQERWEHPSAGIDWAAKEFSTGKFDGLATERINKKLLELISQYDNGSFPFWNNASERFFNKEKIDLVAIPSSDAVLINSQKHLKHLLNSNTLISSKDKTSKAKELASVDIFFQWGITPNKQKKEQYKAAKKLGRPVLIIEDGFIRSVKIGLSGTPTLSIITDDTTAYYDATKQSRLERLLQSQDNLSETQFERAKNAIEKIVKLRVSKYNDSINISLPIGRKSVDKVLLIDQRFGDQSVPSALADEKTFETMLLQAINQNPDSDILIKQHPDALKGGKSSYFNEDMIAKYKVMFPNIYTITTDINPYAMFENVRAVYVVSSGVGFEALMAGKEVHCYGMPFYAGWGLTLDQIKLERRTRIRSVEEIFHYAFIECSRYYNPDEERIVDIENITDYIAMNRTNFIQP